MNGSCSKGGRRSAASGACQGVRKLPQIKIGGVTYTIDLRLSEIRYITPDGLRFFHVCDIYADFLEYALRHNDKRSFRGFVKEIVVQGGSGPPLARD